MLWNSQGNECRVRVQQHRATRARDCQVTECGLQTWQLNRWSGGYLRLGLQAVESSAKQIQGLMEGGSKQNFGLEAGKR